MLAIDQPAETTGRRLRWRRVEVVETAPETARATTLVLDVEGWPGHLAGQHVDVRLTAEDGYQAQRSYSIASPPKAPRLALTVERLEGGEVSPWLAGEARPGDRFELRGPIGGYFTWSVAMSRPLMLVAGGSGVVPLVSMLRHRARVAPEVPAVLVYSARRFDEVIRYERPTGDEIRELIRNRLAMFTVEDHALEGAAEIALGLSHADICQASNDAAKEAVLKESKLIEFELLKEAISHRQSRRSFKGNDADRT